MLYSLSAGGKRIRPLLLFATLSAFGDQTEKGVLPAAAIEMVHTYSLIHDDLPCMDNDDLRRGKPTNHKKFGEATALLAGDALLTYSFQLIAETPEKYATAETKLTLISNLARAAGAAGMVGGQMADMEGEEKSLSLKELEYIHVHKTGKLLQCSILSGAVLAQAPKEIIRLLTDFSYHLGLAFQIRDDILDIEGDEAVIGKPVGSDVQNQKTTYPVLLTLAGAKQALQKHIGLAKQYLKKTEADTVLLEEITDLIANRKK
ncbi:polyprenyl synthetase family protein [Bacillaceae bacterium Marseille-Q3522]|nr:polyprenyl synthetase family protein [Bacillaceae bacterium Marseille-Q3522]